MENWKSILTNKDQSINEVLKIIDGSLYQTALIVDENLSLRGTVTDGDIRRGLIKGIPLEEKIEKVMNKNPICFGIDKGINDILKVLKDKWINIGPVIDNKGQIIDVISKYDQDQNRSLQNPVFLLVGGLGSRIKELTKECPKPLLKVGDRPILETIILNFKEAGFKNFYLSVNYKSKMIEDYFKNGKDWGVDIEYIHEKSPMGTAGSLCLLKERFSMPFFVMNGDLLTKINFKSLLNFHKENKTIATMCIRKCDFQIPYGVVKTNGMKIEQIEEKPTQELFVNAGIYVLNPETLDHIPQNQSYDMPELFENLISKNLETSIFPIREYWLDIGRIDDFKKANQDYEVNFQ